VNLNKTKYKEKKLEIKNILLDNCQRDTIFIIGTAEGKERKIWKEEIREVIDAEKFLKLVTGTKSQIQETQKHQAG
jgi:hypothetical protein